MNFDLIDDLIRMANVMLCLALVVMVLIGFFQRKPIIKPIFFLVLILFVLLNVSLFIETDIDGFIILFNLLILFYFVYSTRNNIKTELSPTINKPTDESPYLLFQAKEQERSRIYANLHDDVGAKLLELIYTAKDDASKSIAKELLSKIRQAVASTENIQCTVDQLIDSLIHESKSRLNSANIELIESIDIKNPNKKLTATMPMTMIRIVRELLNNIIKHAQAGQVVLAIKSDKSQLTIYIRDNGVGFKSTQKNGKGMQTIKKRAESISATTSLQSTPSNGTIFELKYDYADK